MKTFILVHVPRTLLGLLFLVSAVDGFWFIFTGNHLIHPPTSPKGKEFELALQASGFFWPFLKTINLLGALSLLLNVVPAFGLALIAPVMATIVLFHAFINPQGLPVAGILVVLGLMLVWAWRDRYAALFR
jgi:ABC-type sugar transport system permease subunit